MYHFLYASVGLCQLTSTNTSNICDVLKSFLKLEVLNNFNVIKKVTEIKSINKNQNEHKK